MCGELGKHDRTHVAVKVRALQPGNPKVGQPPRPAGLTRLRLPGKGNRIDTPPCGRPALRKVRFARPECALIDADRAPRGVTHAVSAEPVVPMIVQ
jgi:hypothetical protein